MALIKIYEITLIDADIGCNLCEYVCWPRSIDLQIVRLGEKDQSVAVCGVWHWDVRLLVKDQSCEDQLLPWHDLCEASSSLCLRHFYCYSPIRLMTTGLAQGIIKVINWAIDHPSAAPTTHDYGA